MKLNEFLEKILLCKSVNGILNGYKTSSEKGYVYERLWDIIIKFGFCENFKNSRYIHKIGNVNNGTLTDLTNLDNYLQTTNLFSGNSGGVSDITLYDRIEGKYIFISSKFPKSTDDLNKQKSVKYYDVQDIIAMAETKKYLYKNYEIYLVVPDKLQVIEKFKNANKSSDYITTKIKIY